jgi:hypothetical protein
MVDWIIDQVVFGIGKVKWPFVYKMLYGKEYLLTDEDQDIVRNMLAKDHYIILSRRDTHLSTYGQNVAELFLRGKWGYWSHAFLNAEDEVTTDLDFRLIEATASGVHYSTFDKCFDVDGVALLIPDNFTPEAWTLCMQDAARSLGLPYDTMFNMLDANAMSCIELVAHALLSVPDAEILFPEFFKLVRSGKKITPQMLYDCPDFKVVFEIRR